MGVSLAAAAVSALVLVALDTAASAARRARRRMRDDQRLGGERRSPLAALGRWLSRGAVDPPDEVLVGGAAVATAVAAVALGPVGGLACVAAVIAAVAARRRARRRRRILQIDRHLSEVIDLLALVVSTGRPTVAALADICPRVAEPFRTELAAVVRRTTAGEPFVDSVRRLPVSLGASLSGVVYAVTAAEIDGAPLQPALQRAADEAHRRRRVRAEEAARRVPVLMLFPLVFCVLPAFCLLTLVPLLVGTVSELRLGL